MQDLPAYADLPLPTDRELRLRPWRPEDVDAVYAACSDERALRWTFRSYRREQAEAYVRTAPQCWAKRRHLRLCLTDGTGAVLGSGDLDDLHSWHRSSDLGWWIAPAHRARGLGVRLGRLLVRAGLEVLGLQRLTAHVVAGNSASRWVAAGSGLHLESTAREAWLAADRARHDLETWRLLATEDPLPAQPDLTVGALHLRPWLPSDAHDVYEACQDPDIQRYTGVAVPYTMETAEAFTSRTTLGRWASGGGAEFAVVDSTTAGLLASVGAYTHPGGVCEIGYWVAPGARGRGVATAAARAVLRWRRAEFDDAVFIWRAVEGNDASLRIAEKLGFQLEGRNRARFPKDRTVDDLVASLLPGELQ